MYQIHKNGYASANEAIIVSQLTSVSNEVA